MISLIPNLPSSMVGFRATGNVTEDDFKNVVMPAVQNAIDVNGELNYLLVLDTSLKDFSVGAWMQDAVLGAKHLLKWNRAAIVSDVKAIKKFTDLFSYAVPGEFRGFSHAELQDAIAWTAGAEPARA